MPPQIGFYHWQQQLHPDSLNHCLLEATGSEELHIKFFDVVWMDDHAAPRARLEVAADSLPFAVIPVVFITNDVMLHIKEADIPQLAHDIVMEVLRLWTSK